MFSIYTLIELARVKPQIIHAHELLSPAVIAVTAKFLFGTPLLVKVLRGGSFGDIDKLRPAGTRMSLTSRPGLSPDGHASKLAPGSA